ncbi:LytR/AlgR family response regulator transcription factor [Desulfosediminicola flagellatus]|uniref:LytR/AlgR family response regulator transcription factor n=1 Tax=Desulfosediminicola flagellatus TaxID=2569541 RepID=UPI0010ABB21E|nr:LytTR family DNA-binding domain-containing protein [Desulfosediminicola flagellatus]
MKIQCVIVDDEQPARDELRYLLSRYDDVQVTGEADSAGKAVSLIKKITPDLVFLDIQMPGKNGFDVIAELAGHTPMPLFVFATAYDNYAVKAFEESAVDYIMKPFSEKRLDITLGRIRNLLIEEPKESGDLQTTLQELLNKMGTPRETVKVSVEKNGRIQLLAPQEIVFCSCESNGICIHTHDEVFTMYGIATMDKLAEHLAGAPFFRTHRAVLVNLDCIREFSPWFNGKYNLIMNDSKSTELTVSRTRVKAFKQRLGI